MPMTALKACLGQCVKIYPTKSTYCNGLYDVYIDEDDPGASLQHVVISGFRRDVIAFKLKPPIHGSNVSGSTKHINKACDAILAFTFHSQNYLLFCELKSGSNSKAEIQMLNSFLYMAHINNLMKAHMGRYLEGCKAVFVIFNGRAQKRPTNFERQDLLTPCDGKLIKHYSECKISHININAILRSLRSTPALIPVIAL